MFHSVRQRSSSTSDTVVDIAPLIDVVFILLLFFLVSTSFVRDTGIEVERPEAITGVPQESTSLRISIAASGAVYAEGRRRELEELRQLVQQFVRGERNPAVILIPDAEAPAGRLVEVMDAAKLGGAQDIAVATERARRSP